MFIQERSTDGVSVLLCLYNLFCIKPCFFAPCIRDVVFSLYTFYFIFIFGLCLVC